MSTGFMNTALGALASCLRLENGNLVLLLLLEVLRTSNSFLLGPTSISV